MNAARTAIDRFESWFRHDALSLWADAAWDNEKGGFFEALNFDGTPVRGQRRVRVQSRQVYTFSRVAQLGWLPAGEALAAKGFDYLLDHACPDQAARGCGHLLDDNGCITDNRRDLYDQAFLLLACAARIESGCSRAGGVADRVTAFLDTELRSPHGGWLESDRAETPRRQNPHMHLFEAFMALFRATSDNQYLARATHIADDLFPAFMDFSEGVLREYFTDALAKDAERPEIEPGHMFEWVWLLGEFEKLSGEDFGDTRTLLYARAEHFGPDEKFHGFVSNQVDINEKKTRSAKRLWPQTEYLRASCTQARHGDAHALDMISALIDAMFVTYLDADKAGLWIDEFDAHGGPIAPNAPASILYHLFEAVVETVRFKETLEKI